MSRLTLSVASILLTISMITTLMPAHAGSDDPIPAYPAAFNAGCNGDDITDTTDFARFSPILVPIIKDPNHPFPNDPSVILEGRIATPYEKYNRSEKSDDEAPSEVAPEDVPWYHYTHDKTIDVIPDRGYKHLLSGYVDKDGTIKPFKNTMHVEWESGSVMNLAGDNRIWGALPEFVWPSVGDRVWVEGRWVFDCGHTGLEGNFGTGLSYSLEDVKYFSEIHPPRALVTFRLNNGSWLPVTGFQTGIPLTETDIFVSGNGGGANDLCGLLGDEYNESCKHTGPIIPINDRNYVFDIYPPGTDFNPDHKLPNGVFPVHPPTSDGSGSDVSLQWRTIDQSSQIPAHSGSLSVTPLLCQIDETTPPPTQEEKSCPPIPAHPTRLRVILPFKDTNADVFAQSILLGWDDVTPVPLRTLQARLHELHIIQNGEGTPFTDGDWRVFVDVGGQWRYLGDSFDRNSNGKNVCEGDALTENGDGDCFRFDNWPWSMSIQEGKPIHVAIGGFEADKISENSLGVDSFFCRNLAGCDFSVSKYGLIKFYNTADTRIGTIEFDLEPPGYSIQHPIVISTRDIKSGEEEIDYDINFTVQQLQNPSPPVSNQLSIGDPHYTDATGGETYVTSATPLTISTPSTDIVGLQYRFYREGTSLPTFSSPYEFPVHWTNTDFQNGPRAMPVFLNGFDGADGQYILQYSAQTTGGLTEPRHTTRLKLDNTPPVIPIIQPVPTQYIHSATLVLNYTVNDGAGSGVNHFTPTLDGANTLAGHSLQSGQAIDLLTELALGPHTFTIEAVDNLQNANSSSVTFTIIVTADSIKDDVNQFFARGEIKNQGLANSLLAKLNAAAKERTKGNCNTAANIYQAFINELQAQRGKGVDAAAAAIMIADAQYLKAHCP